MVIVNKHTNKFKMLVTVAFVTSALALVACNKAEKVEAETAVQADNVQTETTEPTIAVNQIVEEELQHEAEVAAQHEHEMEQVAESSEAAAEAVDPDILAAIEAADSSSDTDVVLNDKGETEVVVK